MRLWKARVIGYCVKFRSLLDMNGGALLRPGAMSLGKGESVSGIIRIRLNCNLAFSQMAYL